MNKSSRKNGRGRKNTSKVHTRRRSGQLDAKAGRSLFDLIPDAVIIHDGEQILFCNAAALGLYRAKSAEDLIGLHPDRLVHPDEAAWLERRRAVSSKPGGRNPIEEIRRVRLDGTTFYGETTSLGINYNRRHAFMVLTRDITDRKDLERSLRERDGRHEAVIESAVDGIVTMDEKGVIQDANPSAETIFGYGRGELTGKNVRLLMPDSDAKKHASYVSNFLRTGEGKIIGIGREVEGRRKDGTVFPIDLRVSEFQRGGKKCFTGILSDLTKEKDAAAKAKEMEDRLVDAIGGIPIDIILYDSDERFITCSRHFRGGFKNPDEILLPGTDFAAILRAEAPVRGGHGGAAKVDEWIRIRVEMFRRKRGPIEVAHGDGTWQQLNYFETLDGGTLVIREDITKRKKADAKFEAARLDAELANRSKSEFLANMSHELRTPLNAIIGFSDALKNDLLGPFDDEKLKGYFRAINDSGIYLLDLINDILDVSVIEAGKLELRDEPINLAAVAKSSVRMLRQRADGGKVRIVNQIGRDLPAIRADRRRVQQIFVNLLSNAVKFTPEGGRVTLGARRRKNGGLAVFVTDTGIGMDENGITRALEKFGQIKNRHTPIQAGAGLGLPLAKNLIEAHGGKIEIKSEPGQGTTVTVCFPGKRVIQ